MTDEVRDARNAKRRERYANVSDEVKAARNAKRGEDRLRKKAEDQAPSNVTQVGGPSASVVEDPTPVPGLLTKRGVFYPKPILHAYQIMWNFICRLVTLILNVLINCSNLWYWTRWFWTDRI